MMLLSFCGLQFVEESGSWIYDVGRFKSLAQTYVWRVCCLCLTRSMSFLESAAVSVARRHTMSGSCASM
jgi:hypothetical protein